jgi:hypothetical protein
VRSADDGSDAETNCHLRNYTASAACSRIVWSVWLQITIMQVIKLLRHSSLYCTYAWQWESKLCRKSCVVKKFPPVVIKTFHWVPIGCVVVVFPIWMKWWMYMMLRINAVCSTDYPDHAVILQCIWLCTHIACRLSDSYGYILFDRLSHKGPTDRVSAAKIFPLSAFSWADISLTCLNPRCRLSDHPRFASTWSYF